MGEQPTSGLSYRDAGVDIDAGNALADRIRPLAARTRRPELLAGIHLNLLVVRRDPKLASDPRYLAQLKHFLAEEIGYQAIQGTKPQTLAYGLTDSPAGLAAWIVEKFRTWSDCGGNPESAISRDEMLANISLYWFTGAIGSSFWPYYDRMHSAWPIPDGGAIDVPMGYAEFPHEILRPPRSLAETMLGRNNVSGSSSPRRATRCSATHFVSVYVFGCPVSRSSGSWRARPASTSA